MLGSGLCRGPGEADTRAFLEDTGSTEHVERGTAPDQIWCSDPSPLDRIDVMSSKECEEELSPDFHSRFSDHLPILFSIHANDSIEQQVDPTPATQANRIEWREWDRQDKQYYNELFSREQAKRSKSDETKFASGVADDMRKAASDADKARRKRNNKKAATAASATQKNDPEKCSWTPEMKAKKERVAESHVDSTPASQFSPVSPQYSPASQPSEPGSVSDRRPPRSKGIRSSA